MGVLPLQFLEETSAETLRLDGTETYDVGGIARGLSPRQQTTLTVRRANGLVEKVPVTVRIDTPIEVDYYRHGGILPFVLRQLAG
jgi:aconitate hydratase